MIVIEINNLKNVKDKMGKNKGDVLMRIFEERINQIDKKSYVEQRLGGEELVILVLKMND